MAEITNSLLAQKISDLLDAWRTREQQMQAWISGAADGGPYGDGRFPLADYLGVIRYTKSPAALESSVSGSASASNASAIAAAASAAAADIARSLAVTASSNAAAARDATIAARDLTLQYRDASANNLSTTDAYRMQARAWASNAVDVMVEAGLYSARHYAIKTSESLSGIAEDVAQSAANAALALEYKNDAEDAAADAASSAAAAQTWNPANYATLAGAYFTGLVGAGANFYVDTTGEIANTRNIEIKSAGQNRVLFGSYAGHWRPSITIHGQTNAHYMFMVGPDSASTDVSTNARIHSSRGLALSSTNDYIYFRSANGSVYYDEPGTTRKGYVYHDSSGFGLLGSTGGWAVRTPAGASRVEIPGNDIRSNYYYGLGDPSKYIGANVGSFTYGSMFVGGTGGGYVGLVLYEGIRNPTLMSNGAARGLYCQANSQWDWYCTDFYMYFNRIPYQSVEGSGGAVLRYVQGQTGGRIWIQQGGSPLGSQEGDLTLIW